MLTSLLHTVWHCRRISVPQDAINDIINSLCLQHNHFKEFVVYFEILFYNPYYSYISKIDLREIEYNFLLSRMLFSTGSQIPPIWANWDDSFSNRLTVHMGEMANLPGFHCGYCSPRLLSLPFYKLTLGYDFYQVPVSFNKWQRQHWAQNKCQINNCCLIKNGSYQQGQYLYIREWFQGA